MPQSACSSGILSGAICVMLAAAAAGLGSPAHAECVTQLTQQAPEGAHWGLYRDRVTNQRCWILVDASGRELSPPAPQAQQPPTTAKPAEFQSFLGSFTGGGPPPPPPQPQVTAAPAAAPPPRRPRHVNVHHRPAGPHPAGQEAGRETRQETRREMSQTDRDALFEEFLRWHESQKITGGK
jgi:hypothetical protein